MIENDMGLTTEFNPNATTKPMFISDYPFEQD